MKRFTLLLILLTSVTLMAQEEITIKATGAVEYTIDKISVQISLSSKDEVKETADDLTHEKALKILHLLGTYGFTKDDIITKGSRVSQQNSRQKDDPVVYVASMSYSFVLDSVDLYDTIKNDLLKNGVESVSFEPFADDVEAYRKQAFQQALDNARENATLIASEFGNKKVRLIKIIDGGVGYNQYQRKLEDDMIGRYKNMVDFDYYTAACSVARESTITKLTGTTRVELLVVFEVK